MTNATSPSVQPSLGWIFQSASRAFAFGFGSGLSPIAPGTAGTLWAWAIFLILQYFASPIVLLSITVIGFIVGCQICGQTSEELGKPDFGGIVWDEMIAFWLILNSIAPSSLWTQMIAFGLFRFFDAVKPGPIGAIDRHFKTGEKSSTPPTPMQIRWRGFGIMIDDIAAAICTLLLLALYQTLRVHTA